MGVGAALCWASAVPGVGIAAGAAFSGAIDPLAPGAAGWLSALAGNLAAQGVLLVSVSVVLCAAFRRWGALAVSIIPALVLATHVLGVERAPRASGAPRGPVLRVLTLNMLASNPDAQGAISAMIEADADVIMLNEPSGALLDTLPTDRSMREAYPHDTLVARAGPGYRFVLSRHPILRGENGFGFIWPEIRERMGYHGQRVVRVETPAGPVVFVGVQFRSPRGTERWAAGNAQAADLAAGLRVLRERVRLPMIMAGDFNATPTGRRSRDLGAALGLARCKPALLPGGTWPAGWPLSLAIDGVMVSEGVRVRHWRTVRVPGSDHEGVLVELELPGVPGSSSSP